MQSTGKWHVSLEDNMKLITFLILILFFHLLYDGYVYWNVNDSDTEKP